MKTLGIILARAGSKGLPRKNALPLAGKPLLRWTIDHALGSASLNHVVLSTDGDELRQIGLDADVDVLDRPADLAHDAATVDAAARDGLHRLEQQRGMNFDVVVILYGNVPLRPADLTDRAVAKLRDTGCDSVQSVCPVGKMHPFWMKRLDGDRLLMYEQNAVYRRQDLPPVYMLDGGVIAVTRASIMIQRDGEPHAFLGHDRRAIVTEPNEVLDIDTPLDLKFAEALLS